MGSKPGVGTARMHSPMSAWLWPPHPASGPSTASIVQPSGRKSQAVDVLAGGMPGVSGELKLNGPPISARWAKEPGVVPCPVEDGSLAP